MEPLAPEGVALFVRKHADAGALEVGLPPGVDSVDREPTPADRLDAERLLGEDGRVDHRRLDGGDDLDALGERRERRRRGPGVELVELVAQRVHGVLRDQRRVKAEPLGQQDLVAHPRPGRIERIVGVAQGGEAAVDVRPHAEAKFGNRQTRSPI